MTDIFLSSGEASGDLEAALLLQEMRRLKPGIAAAAIGSDRLRGAGATITQDSSEWASIGPLSALAKIPKLYLIMRRTDLALRRDPPRIIVPVDFGAFNLRLLQQMRGAGYRRPIVYYFPPGAWLDNETQARAVASTAIPLTALARQRDFYRRLGLRCEWFGHPLVSAITPRGAQEAHWPSELGIEPTPGPRIVVFPGSRGEEIDLMIDRLAAAAASLARTDRATFVVAGASDARVRQIVARWPRAAAGMAPAIARGEAIERALRAADLAWVASGTASLETALREVPQIGFYAISRAQYRIAQRRVPQFVRGPLTLPNLLLGRRIVPELLQDELTPDALVEQTQRLLSDAQARGEQLRGYAELRAALGPPDALTQIARFVLETMDAGA